MVDDQGGFEDALSSFTVDPSLLDRSPCLGAGEGGSDMGAATGVCRDPRLLPVLLIRLAAGTYTIEGWDLSRRVSLVGAGEAQTRIEGSVRGLREETRVLQAAAAGRERVIDAQAGRLDDVRDHVNRLGALLGEPIPGVE